MWQIESAKSLFQVMGIVARVTISYSVKSQYFEVIEVHEMSKKEDYSSLFKTGNTSCLLSNIRYGTNQVLTKGCK